MQHYTPAPSFSRYVQSLHGMNEEIKLIVFLKMMKEITQNVFPLQMRFRRRPVGACDDHRGVPGHHCCAAPVPSGRPWLG